MTSRSPHRSRQRVPAEGVNRRAFATFGLGALGAAAFGFWVQTGPPVQAGTFHHRPPGAGGLRAGGESDPVAAERQFLERCVRCGQCAGPCPVQELDGVRRKAIGFYGAGPLAGTPYITPRAAPCLMCEDLPCVQVCPSGALAPALLEPAEARMGTAVIVDREGCLAIQGLRCEICYNRCPARGEALTLEHTVNPRTGVHAILEPVVHKDACTGCGICEHVCPRDTAVIRVGRWVPQPEAADQFYQFKPVRNS